MKVAWIDFLDQTPLGSIWIARSARGLVAVEIAASQDGFPKAVERLGFSEIITDTTRMASPKQQLREYLGGQRTTFDVSIDWTVMTPFQEQVLRFTYQIPFGETTTYGHIAHQIGKPRAARAVGRAQATNPMPIIIPCHRVIGADGGLHGYGAPGGIATKAWLLRLEGVDRS